MKLVIRNILPNNRAGQLTKCCKKNPLALSVIGGRLKGTQMESWHHTLKKLSQATHPLIDLPLDEANRFHLARALGLLKDDERNSPRSSTSKLTRSYQVT
ncbi:NB-ARC domains-containing protein [Artemisia annua]|uniref:NB-ARC domains-containing protein n=1 Tax=Artemisia annua TaxID=35608 RepID=A0A2U1QPI5_ARTAN|nr:NB-ARC domains-containing protein [Artemisia annua]